MRKLEVYINGQLCDVDARTIIATTVQGWDPANMKARYISHTNKFKLPRTKNNIRIFQQCQNSKVETNLPYQSNSGYTVQNGRPMLAGIVEMDEVGEDFAVVIYGGIRDFYATIGEKTLNQLDFSEFNDLLDDGYEFATENATKNTTSGIVSPIINHGFNVTEDSAGAGTQYRYQAPASSVLQILPSVYYHTILDKIFTQAGFSYEGDVLTDERFLKMIVYPGNSGFPWNYSEQFYADRSVIASGVPGRVYSAAEITAGTVIEFPNVIQQGAKNYYNPSTYYYSTDGYEADNFQQKITVTLDIQMDPGDTVRVRIRSGTTDIYDTSALGPGVHILEATVESLDYPDINIYLSFWGPSPTATFAQAVLKIEAIPSMDPPTVGTARSVIEMYNEVLPPFTQKEFIDDFLFRFGLIPTEKNATITLKHINDVIADRKNAVDWTQKRVGKTETINWKSDNLGKINRFKYAQTSEGTNEFTGYGKFSISNNLLDEIIEYDSLWGSSEQSSLSTETGVTPATKDFSFANTKVWTDNTSINYDNDPGARLLLVRDTVVNEPPITYSGAAPDTNYKIAFFEDYRFGSVTWQAFLDDYWPRYIAVVQSGIKNVSRFYNLTEDDVASFDVTQLIYENGEYFMLKKIHNYVPGQETKVELFKVS